MKTTVEIEDKLYREAKVTAAQRGITMKDLIQTALRRELTADAKPLELRHVKFPPC
jgi:hypothetical protein